MQFSFGHKTAAPGEARTHGLQIMRLTRCLLRYRGFENIVTKNKFDSRSYEGERERKKKTNVPTGGLEPPIFGLGDRRLIH